MLDLLRRVAVLALVSAAGIGLLAPLSVRSATPVEARTARLLDAAADHAPFVSRSARAGRERSASLSLASVVSAPVTETLGVVEPLPTAAAVSFAARIRPIVTPRPRPRLVAPPVVSNNSVSGKASFYCHKVGTCPAGWTPADAFVALPGALGGHGGRGVVGYVTVCADRCARLPVVDYCACYWGTANQKVADLSATAWKLVTDRDMWTYGVVRVTLRFG